MSAIWEYALQGVDPLEHIMRRLEAMVHENGWDAKPQFYALSQLDNDEVPWSERPAPPEELKGVIDEEWEKKLNAALAVGELPLPEFVYEDPARGLPMLLQFLGEIYEGKGEPRAEDGREVGREDIIKLLDRLVPKGFYGFGMCYEAWSLPDSVPQEERLQHANNHTMHLRPDRIEMRALSFCTRDGRFGTVMRNRGEFPVYEMADDARRIEGRIPDVMRRITLLFAGFDALRSGRIPRFSWGQPSSN